MISVIKSEDKNYYYRYVFVNGKKVVTKAWFKRSKRPDPSHSAIKLASGEWFYDEIRDRYHLNQPAQDKEDIKQELIEECDELPACDWWKHVEPEHDITELQIAQTKHGDWAIGFRCDGVYVAILEYDEQLIVSREESGDLTKFKEPRYGGAVAFINSGIPRGFDYLHGIFRFDFTNTVEKLVVPQLNLHKLLNNS